MVRLRAVGECLIDVDGQRVGPEAELAFALLLVLTLARGRPVGRRQLTDLLWPATSEARARHNLRQTLYKLRQLGVPLVAESTQVRLPTAAIAPHVLLDGELDGPPPAELIRPDLPFGEFLAGYAPRFSAPFALWLDEQRAVMHARLRRALLAVLADERRRGSWGSVETLARKVLQLDPLNEEATLALAEATALTGSKRAALAILDEYLRELGDGAGDIRLPATLLRRRIAERLQPGVSPAASDVCFVGRAPSVAFLNEQFALARDAGSRTVLVWGDAGIGKSRLVTELAQIALLDGAQVPRVACQARDAERPLSVFVDVVPLLLALPGALGCSPESLGFLKRLTAHDPAVLEPSAATREAELLFANVRRAIFDLVDAVASEAPLVLVFEDVHWLDEQSWRVMRELIGWLEGRPVLVLITSRLPHATPTPPARQAPGLVLHRLPALDADSAAALFDAVTADAAPPAAFRDWCLQVAEGNPMSIRTLATHWLDTGELRAPPEIAEVFNARLRRLSSSSLRVLQASAVLGRNSTFDRVELMLEYKRYDLLESIVELEEQGLLARAAASLLCKHDQIVAAALRTLDASSYQLLHRCAGHIIEAEIERTHDAGLLWDCAEHWREAGSNDRAVSLARSVATHLIEMGLPQEAAGTLERASAISGSNEERVELLFRAAQASRLAGQWTSVLAALESLRSLGTTLGSRDKEVELLALEARWRTNADTKELLACALKLAQEPATSVAHRLSGATLALIFADHLCDGRAAHQIYTTAAGIRGFDDRLDVTAQRLTVSLIYHSSYGDLQVAHDTARQLVRALYSTGVSERVRNLCRASIPLRRCGEYADAVGYVTEALELAEAHRLAFGACAAADILSTCALERGDLPEAAAWFERAQRWLGAQDGAEAATSVGYLGARVALACERPDEAARLLPVPLAMALQDSSVRRRNEALAIHLDVALRLGDKSEATLQALHVLEAGHIAARCHGGQDYSTAMLVRGLAEWCDPAHARELLGAYLSQHRRERGPVPSYLAALY